MNLTKLQFDFLVYIESHSGKHLTQRDIALGMDISLGSVNKFITFFVKEKLIEVKNKCISITKKGLEFLEPYRVKNAIILAAGFSERLAPLTLTTPKPLIKVNGIRIIDTIIDALNDNGIKDIYVVVGYMKEQFYCLLEKYPFIKFIENPLFNESKNISSLYFAKEKLNNTYICEGDIFITNKSIIKKYQYESCYYAIFEENTDDWCFKVTNSYIKHLSIGGSNVYRMSGISYWDLNDSKKIQSLVNDKFNSNGGKELFWDEVLFDKRNPVVRISIDRKSVV